MRIKIQEIVEVSSSKPEKIVNRYRQVIFHLLLILVVGVAGSSCSLRDGLTVQIMIDGSTPGTPLYLKYKDKSYTLPVDSVGSAEFKKESFSNSCPGILQYGKFILPVYLHKNQNFQVYINLSPEHFGAEFYGHGAVFNEIWNGKYMRQFSEDDFQYNEKEFLKLFEEANTSYQKKLDSLYLDRKFIKKAIAKNQYKLFRILAEYPEKYQMAIAPETYVPSQNYIDFATEFLSNAENALEDGLYRNALLKWMEIVGEAGEAADSYSKLKVQSAYIEKKVGEPATASFLTYNLIIAFVAENGIKYLAELEPFFLSKVKESDRINHFEEMCDSWRKLTKGQPAPPFTATRQDSSLLSLRDFRGNYLYLCIWSPEVPESIAEIQRYGWLRNQLKEKNISFTAICYGGGKEQWENIVKAKSLRGIQLYMENNDHFLKDYLASSFPRFLLIDSRGNILQPDMLPPSSPKILEELNKLWPQPQKIVRDTTLPTLAPLNPETRFVRP